MNDTSIDAEKINNGEIQISFDRVSNYNFYA